MIETFLHAFSLVSPSHDCQKAQSWFIVIALLWWEMTWNIHLPYTKQKMVLMEINHKPFKKSMIHKNDTAFQL